LPLRHKVLPRAFAQVLKQAGRHKASSGFNHRYTDSRATWKLHVSMAFYYLEPAEKLYMSLDTPFV
jgi:hypothetical protein